MDEKTYRLFGVALTKQQWIITFLLVFFLGYLVFMTWVKQRYFLHHTAAATIINTDSLSKDSSIIENHRTEYLSLQAYNGFVYKAQSQGQDAVYEFLNAQPQYSAYALIPDNFAQTASLTKTIKDTDDAFLKKNNLSSGNEHYFFTQAVNNVPVYGANLTIHLRNGNEIYAVQGNLIKDATVPQQNLPDDAAKDIALEKARQETTAITPLFILDTQKYIVNKKVLGIANDETNYLTAAITVKTLQSKTAIQFEKQYFVDLTAGVIVFEQNVQGDLLTNRWAPKDDLTTTDSLKLFSPVWDCKNQQADMNTNTKLVTHAHELMTHGGTFNGCSVAAVNQTIVDAITHQALTKYLQLSANDKDYYTAMMNSCNDLYGLDSATCITVHAALSAVEFNQQMPDSKLAPQCSGGTERPAVCSIE